MHIHLIGIGGEGMSGLAKLALSLGHSVSGSELASKISLSELRALGADISNVHSVKNVAGADLVVRSSGIPMTHDEVVAARTAGIELIKRSECLGRLLRTTGQRVIRIAGSYGKSTTTTMLGSILRAAGLDPTIIVGAYVPTWSSHAVIGNGPYAVVECCEFDRSFHDIPGFWSVVTSIEADHLDHYTNGIVEITSAFLEFAGQTDPNGRVLVCVDNANVQKAFLSFHTRSVQTYGLGGGDWQARTVSVHGGSHFAVTFLGKEIGTFRIEVPGRHYVQNALAAVAVARSLGASSEAIREGLENYHGVVRRYETVLKRPELTVIDDYGHTPLEIRTVLTTIREQFPNAFLVCVPCLRQFHRTRRLLSAFVEVLSEADVCVIAPIVRGLGDVDGDTISITHTDVAAELNKRGTVAYSGDTCEQVVMAINSVLEVTPGEKVVLTIGSGVSADIWKGLK